MRTLFLLCTTLFLSTSLLAQGTYEDLLIIKADGDWEKLIKKAEKYTLKNSTKKDPVPYYYLSYGLYKISFRADRDDAFKNAYKDAFTSIGKMLRYDKDGSVAEKYAEFVSELKMSLLEIIQNETENEEYRRAFGWTMRLYKFGRDYAPVYYLEGALRYRRGDKSTANNKWKDGDKLLKDAEITSWSKPDKKIFMLGLYQSALALKEDRQTEKAQEIMNIGAPYFEENETWSMYYDEIVN
ncbi:hypothetical protein CW751_03645 [Brumimicrobium salinarum]|uniref:Tetratricopeptide repeat protein n=1 Tax=Brumimicrobium salinarum TaxID=2058658 RepID=A0A2I0R512_9FLAO|nr:hypothetical protein [Brumimicrobium salinarum]PKR81629.1 hypothetical protein CW751_03645 [Brumimicrobium salinarum]